MRVPDAKDWLAFCTECFGYREFRLVHERDPDERQEYLEVVCETCEVTLFTFKPRLKSSEARPKVVSLKKPRETSRPRRTE
jgi:hypothetical protein